MIRNRLLIPALTAAFMASGTPAQSDSFTPSSDLTDSDLTPFGAEQAGNEDEIPEWTGGLSEAPDSYQDDHRYTNPFPDDEPLFRIDQGNLEEHKARLSDGQIAMLEQHDDYFIPVYETRRTATFPDSIKEATSRNAEEVSLTDDGNGLENYEEGIPFPEPENGLEVIFNHLTRYRGGAVERNVTQAAPQPDGDFSPVTFNEELVRPNHLVDYDPDEHDNILFYYTGTITDPSREAGNVLLIHEPIDQTKQPRQAWAYNAGQRRVRQAPQAAYDSPSASSDGQRTADNVDLYNGAPDQYDWELKGKREMYIPYNSYEFMDADLSYDEIVRAGHVNQEHARYELHRVWHVRATLKDDERHVYEKRDFYIDEDSWQIALVDHYDERGDLWRVAEAHKVQAYDIDVPFYAFETIYDLMSGRYVVAGMTNEEDEPYEFGIQRRSSEFTSSALRRSGR